MTSYQHSSHELPFDPILNLMDFFVLAVAACQGVGPPPPLLVKEWGPLWQCSSMSRLLLQAVSPDLGELHSRVLCQVHAGPLTSAVF